jgi:hypothetical protein
VKLVFGSGGIVPLRTTPVLGVVAGGGVGGVPAVALEGAVDDGPVTALLDAEAAGAVLAPG